MDNIFLACYKTGMCNFILCEAWKNGRETLQLIQQAYGSVTVSGSVVSRWWNHFRIGKITVINDQ